MPQINFHHSDNGFELNGVQMTRNDVSLFLGLHGYDADVKWSDFEFYSAALTVIIQMPENELVSSLDIFSALNSEGKEILAKSIEIKRRMVKNLTVA